MQHPQLRAFLLSYLFAVAMWEKKKGALLESMPNLPSLELGAWSSLCVLFVQTMWSLAVCWEPSILSLLCWALYHGHPCFLGSRKRQANGIEAGVQRGEVGCPPFFSRASPTAASSDFCLSLSSGYTVHILSSSGSPSLGSGTHRCSSSGDSSFCCLSSPKVKSQ